MKLQFVLSVLPLLAVGQTTSAQNFATLCGSGQTTGTTTLGGEQFTYHCNKRASVSNVAGKTVNINDPKDCSARATGNTAAVGVSWRSNGECYISSAGPPVTQTGCIFFEKLANTGGGTPDPCCLERDNLQTQLQTCQAERSQFQSDLTSCQTGAATCQASLTSCQTGAATCQASLTSCQASNSGTGPGSGPGSGGRVSDCRGVARTEGMGTQQQAGHSWSVNCNSSKELYQILHELAGDC
ncbi:hypothetical protein N7475_002063 [Penicillium sp. IBT 31633x]|nr:hypothetical protein N7475_002063 [Penicillium sp. IBT 31633x]